MYIVFENGRLGNQLFQYAAIRGSDLNGLIFAFGMSDIRKLLRPRYFSGIDLPKDGKVIQALFRGFVQLLRVVLLILCRVRIIGSVSEGGDGSCNGVVRRRGVIPNLYYVELGFWQRQDVVEKARYAIPKIDSEFELRALSLINELDVLQENLYFVHVRRGDYNYWPSPQYPAVVPLRWYEEQISNIRAKNPNAFFLIFSDDVPYVTEFFSNKIWSKVCVNSLYDDFSLMAHCYGGGVLSASSFAWWAAYYVKEKSSIAYFVAPLYWAGHRQESWYPSLIKTDWIDYCPVS